MFHLYKNFKFNKINKIQNSLREKIFICVLPSVGEQNL